VVAMAISVSISSFLFPFTPSSPSHLPLYLPPYLTYLLLLHTLSAPFLTLTLPQYFPLLHPLLPPFSPSFHLPASTSIPYLHFPPQLSPFYSTFLPPSSSPPLTPGYGPKKPGKVQMSNWALRDLSPQQVQYAAYDALMGKDIYDFLDAKCT
jgi:hypothetical protein